MISSYVLFEASTEQEVRSLLVRVKEESERAGLKLSILKMGIMPSGPITSWQIEGEKAETVTDFIFLGSKITKDGDGSHETKKKKNQKQTNKRNHLLLGRKTITNPSSMLKSRDIALLTKVHIVKAMVLPGVT